MLKPILRKSSVDECEAELRRSILRGALKPGKRLPPERTLAEKFQVNRVTVRSALARLAAANLLSVRQGSGYVVRDFRHDGGTNLLPALLELARGTSLVDTAGDLLSIRRHLARAVLERLARGTTAEARAQIAEKVDALEAAVERGEPQDALAERDIAVLQAIVDATGSAVLALCMNPLAAVLARVSRLREAIYTDAAESAPAYRALLMWMGTPDATAIPIFIEEFERRDQAALERLGSK